MVLRKERELRIALLQIVRRSVILNDTGSRFSHGGVLLLVVCSTVTALHAKLRWQLWKSHASLSWGGQQRKVGKNW